MRPKRFDANEMPTRSLAGRLISRLVQEVSTRGLQLQMYIAKRHSRERTYPSGKTGRFITVCGATATKQSNAITIRRLSRCLRTQRFGSNRGRIDLGHKKKTSRSPAYGEGRSATINEGSKSGSDYAFCLSGPFLSRFEMSQYIHLCMR